MNTAAQVWALGVVCLAASGAMAAAPTNSEKIRVILDTDANNELDDQHAIAYLLFNGDVFDVEGITVNRTKAGGGVDQHLAEAQRVVRLCGLDAKIPVLRGADKSFDEIRGQLDQSDFDGAEAVNFIIERARAADKRPLVLLPVGKLTNIALALAKEPAIIPNVRVVWLGSNYPDPGEYNQVNDEPSLNYLLDTNVAFEIAIVRYGKPSGTDAVRATLAEIRQKMPGTGPQVSPPVKGRHGGEFRCFGDYSVSLFENIRLHGDPPSRALFDMAAVAIVKNPNWAKPVVMPAPILKDGRWVDRPDNPRKITLWEDFGRAAIMNDFYDRMKDYQLADASLTTAMLLAEEDVAALLKREIIGPELPLAEVQRFTESRVPRMQAWETATQWQAEAERLRQAVLDRVVFGGAAARWRDAETKVQWLEAIEGGPGYRIKKLRYEALPGMWIPALLYEPDQLAGRVPVVLNVNGHTALGQQYPPKQLRCINQAKRGMLALNVEWLGMGQLSSGGFSHARMNQLDLCGASGMAPFYLAMQRGLDVLLSLENADPERVAVTGLSGGGWQTIVLSALDTRVTLSNPVAGYSSFLTRARHFKDLGDSEQTPNDMATLVDYTHLTAMMAPRATLLTYNAKDECCFESGYALQPLLDAAQPVFRLFGKQDALRWHVNEDPGTHNFEVDNRQALYRMTGDFFFAGEDGFDVREIASGEEIKTAEQLHVELPTPNEDFHTLALALSTDLPRSGNRPQDPVAADRWLSDLRKQLREVVRAKDYQVIATEAARETRDGVEVISWRLMMDADWTLPVIELAAPQATKTVLLVADGGRGTAASIATQWLHEGYRVIAIDPFYVGEARSRQSGWLFTLLVAAVGDRALGLQASQVAAAARWAAERHEGASVTLVATGPRSSVFALIAAALETKAIAAVELHQTLGSLKEVLERNWPVTEAAELFCFGLLECCDIRQLAALAAPRPVRLVAPSERAQQELEGLAQWDRSSTREE